MESSGSWTGIHFKKNAAKQKPVSQEVVHYRPHAKRGRPPLKNLIENKGFGETFYQRSRSKSPGSVTTNATENSSYYKRKKYKAPPPPPNGHIPNGTPFVRQNSFRSVQTSSTTDSALKAKKRRAPPPPPPIIPEGPPPGSLTRRVSDESLNEETHSVHTISADVHNDSGDIDAELEDAVSTIERARKEVDDIQKENDSGISSNDSAYATTNPSQPVSDVNVLKTKANQQSYLNSLNIQPPSPPVSPPPDDLSPQVYPSAEKSGPHLQSGTTSMTNTLQTDPGSILTDITMVEEETAVIQPSQETSVIPVAPPIVLPIKPTETKYQNNEEVKVQTNEEFLQVKLKRVTSLNKAVPAITKFDLFKSELARAAMERSKKGHVEPPPKRPWHLQLQEELTKAVEARESRRKVGTVKMRRIHSQTTVFPARKSDSESLPTTPRDNVSQPASPRDKLSQLFMPLDSTESEPNKPSENLNQTTYPAVKTAFKEAAIKEHLQEDMVSQDSHEDHEEETIENVVLLSQKPIESDTSTQSQSVILGSEPEEEGWTPQVDLTDDDSSEEQEMITARGKTNMPNSFHLFNESPSTQKKKKNKKGNLSNIRKSVKNAFGTIGRAVKRRKKIDEMLDGNWEICQTEEYDDLPAGIVNVDVDHIEKRPAYAYHPSKGQLILLPEYETVIVTKDGKRIQESALRNGKQKKDKKYSYQKTERRKEKERLDRELSKAINAREILFDEERAKNLEMERRYKEVREKKKSQHPVLETTIERKGQYRHVTPETLNGNDPDYHRNNKSLDSRHFNSSYSPTDQEEGDVDSPLPAESDHKTESEANPSSSRLEDSGFTDGFSISTGTWSQHSPVTGAYKASSIQPNRTGQMNGDFGQNQSMVMQNGMIMAQGMQPNFVSNQIPGNPGLLQPQYGFIQGGPYIGYPMNMQTLTAPAAPMQPMNIVPMVPMQTLVSQQNPGYIISDQANNGQIKGGISVPQTASPPVDTNNNLTSSNEKAVEADNNQSPVVPPLDLSILTKDDAETEDNPDKVNTSPPPVPDASHATTPLVPPTGIPVAPPPPPVAPLTKDILTNGTPKGR